jgi:ABC-type branched-subunit amino acid transport system permease subunit
MSAYLIAMAISAGIYALLALGVNLTWGMAGLVNRIQSPTATLPTRAGL